MVPPDPAAPPAEDSAVSPEAAAAAAAAWSPSVEYPASRNLEPLNRRGFLDSCSCQRASMPASTCPSRGAKKEGGRKEKKQKNSKIAINQINQSR